MGANAREECLNHFLVFGRRHLQVVLREYVAHYNARRPHRSLALVPPDGPCEPRASPLPSDVGRRDVLGGLIHEYHVLAA
jgi:transposase InsO family protein